MTTKYTVSDALNMLRAADVDLASELKNFDAAYADITNEIERDGGEADFSRDEYLQALMTCTRLRS